MKVPMLSACGLVILSFTVSGQSIYSFDVLDIDGNSVSMENYRGKVLFIVNVASKCGFTYQYEGLQVLYDTYKDRGFTVLGFPSNDFLHQEPGTNEDIKEFCTLNYGVNFPMFTKIKVKGRNAHPLYQFLTGKDTNPGFSGRIKWNFTKFLISRDGQTLARFSPNMKPGESEIITAIENALE